MKNKVDVKKILNLYSKDFIKKIVEKYNKSPDKIKVGFIGQDRAIDTLKFAVSINKDKYNIYAAGSFGLGKRTIIQKILCEIVKDGILPDDWVYIHNFDNPDEPICIRLPNSMGKFFKERLEESIKNLRQNLKKAFEDDKHIQLKEQLIREYSKRKEKIIFEMQQEASNYGFSLQPTSGGFFLSPTIGGKPISAEELQTLEESIRKEIEKNEEILEKKIEERIRELRSIDKELFEKLKQIDKELANKWVSFYLEEFKKELSKHPKYNSIQPQDNEKIKNYLEDLSKDINENLEIFLRFKSNEDGIPNRYKVNLIVDNSKSKGVPIVFEEFPTLENLVGKIDREAIQGILITDFTMIYPGAFHKANGGYLILNIMDVLREYFAYDALKRTIKNKKIIIEDIHSKIGISTRILRPEPIPFEGKIILLGPPIIYHLLYEYDEDFREYFHVVAYFEEDVDFNQLSFFSNKEKKKVLEHYIMSILNILKTSSGKKIDPEAVAYLLHHLHRLEGSINRLPLKMSYIENILIEASTVSNGNTITASDIDKAIELWENRNSFYKEKAQKYILENMISISTKGYEVGVVNGLSVIQIGQMSFGKPTRITASVGIGKEGVISIEKEVGFSGQIHKKAVMIITGYLIEKYSQDFPLTLQARITFEQNYGFMEGDSASCAEVLAIISQLSSVPVNQSIAITGSMNQKGMVQPVGGIIEKVEGFYEICKHRGHLGKNTGVIIPHQNIHNLVLKKEILRDIQKGIFNIYAVENIDQVIEIATGVKAKKVHSLVYKKLKEYYEKVGSKKNARKNARDNS
ncbi:MAG: ATP-binding protein [bacterium]